MVSTVSAFLVDAGVPHRVAERARMLHRGRLVYARDIGSARAFKGLLKSLPDELLEDTREQAS